MLVVHAFWKWFYEHRTFFCELQPHSRVDSAFYYDELSERLAAFGPTLSFVITSGTANERSKFVLTTNGKPEGVLLVQNLVDLAPDIPGWEIIAFVQPCLDLKLIRKRKDPSYHFQELSIKASDIVWIPGDYNDDTGRQDLIFGFINLASAIERLPYHLLDDYVSAIVLDLLGELLVCKTFGEVCYSFIKADYDTWFKIDFLPIYLKGELGGV